MVEKIPTRQFVECRFSLLELQALYKRRKNLWFAVLRKRENEHLKLRGNFNYSFCLNSVMDFIEKLVVVVALPSYLLKPINNCLI